MRFQIRPTESGWGVWDSGTNGLRTICTERVDAQQAMLELNLAFNPHGPRPQKDRRRPAQPVPVRRWVPAGELVAWVRDRGEWIGAVRTADGQIVWIAAAALQPALSAGTPER